MVWAKFVTVMRWCVQLQDEVNQEESEQDEVDGMKNGADSTGKVWNAYYLKQRLVIGNKEDMLWRVFSHGGVITRRHRKKNVRAVNTSGYRETACQPVMWSGLVV